jgi:hypothetical protein
MNKNEQTNTNMFWIICIFFEKNVNIKWFLCLLFWFNNGLWEKIFYMFFLYLYRVVCYECDVKKN